MNHAIGPYDLVVLATPKPSKPSADEAVPFIPRTFGSRDEAEEEGEEQ